MQDTLTNIKNLGIAAVGSAGVEIAGAMQFPGPEEIQGYSEIVMQILIGVATLYRLVKDNRKRRKSRKNQDGNQGQELTNIVD